MPELTNYHGLGTSQRNHTLEGSQAVLNRAYVYANGKLIAEQTPDGQFYWTHNDHLNSTRKLTNTSGVVVYRAEFDPFGQAVLETGSVSLNSRKFTGYERDWATGLDNANARMFASLRGRFMQSDPVSQGCGNKNPDILAGASKTNPESLNRYGYVRNDPVNFIDPSGLNAQNPDEVVIPGFCPAQFSTEECRERGWSPVTGGGIGQGWGGFGGGFSQVGSGLSQDWQPRQPKNDYRSLVCRLCILSCVGIGAAVYAYCRTSLYGRGVISL